MNNRPRVTRRETEDLSSKIEEMTLPPIPSAPAFKVITPRNKRGESDLAFAKQIKDKLQMKEKERSEY